MANEMSDRYRDVTKHMTNNGWHCQWQEPVPWVGFMTCYRREARIVLLQAFTEVDGDNGAPQPNKIQGFTWYEEAKDGGNLDKMKEMLS